MNTPAEHEFAPYIRIVGRGRHGARSLTQEEAQAAMTLILEDRVEPVQLGAFFMLLRVKEETPEELAGFVEAVRARLAPLAAAPAPDLDWPSYAGKRRHLPWFVLAALLLAQSGVRVLMHGADNHTAGRIYTSAALAALGIAPCDSPAEAMARLAQQNFAYLPLAAISPRLQEILDLRALLGLRSSVHTIARLLNPFHAPHSVQGVFHPAYRTRHRQVAMLLQDPHIAVLKGEGGEFERDPDASATLYTLDDGVAAEQTWPALFAGRRHARPPVLEPAQLAALWRGEAEDDYAEAAVTGTAAMVLTRLGRAADQETAQKEAARLWRERRQTNHRPAAD